MQSGRNARQALKQALRATSEIADWKAAVEAALNESQ